MGRPSRHHLKQRTEPGTSNGTAGSDAVSAHTTCTPSSQSGEHEARDAETLRQTQIMKQSTETIGLDS